MTPCLKERTFDHEKLFFLSPLQVMATAFKEPIDSTLSDSIHSDLDVSEFSQDVLNHIIPNHASCSMFEYFRKDLISSICMTIYFFEIIYFTYLMDVLDS